MNALLTAEMAVWAPEDAIVGAAAHGAPQNPQEAASSRGLWLSGTVLAVSVLSALAAGVMSAFGTI